MTFLPKLGKRFELMDSKDKPSSVIVFSLSILYLKIMSSGIESENNKSIL